MSQIPVSQVNLTSGQIILKDQLPNLAVGRSVIATIIAQPKNGLVLVSMFGKKIMVETTMQLQKGQVLNLQVQSTSPKIILKQVNNVLINKSALLQNASRMIEQSVGKAGDIPLKNFSLHALLKEHLESTTPDKLNMQYIKTLLDEAVKYPEVLLQMLIPVVQDESKGQARVTVQQDPDQSYSINFEMETDNLGPLGCTARISEGIEVEVRVSSENFADFMRPHLHELLGGLEAIGTVKRLEIVVTPSLQPRVNTLV